MQCRVQTLGPHLQPSDAHGRAFAVAVVLVTPTTGVVVRVHVLDLLGKDGLEKGDPIGIAIATHAIAVVDVGEKHRGTHAAADQRVEHTSEDGDGVLDREGQIDVHARELVLVDRTEQARHSLHGHVVSDDVEVTVVPRHTPSVVDAGFADVAHEDTSTPLHPLERTQGPGADGDDSSVLVAGSDAPFAGNILVGGLGCVLVGAQLVSVDALLAEACRLTFGGVGGDTCVQEPVENS